MKLLYFLLITLVFANQYVPIPTQPPGYAVNAPSQLIIEVYYDLICPDSKIYFNIFDQLLKTALTNQFQYVIQIYPLPYHIAAYIGAQGFRYLQDNHPGLAAYEFARSMYTHLDELTNTANLDVTHQGLINKINQLAIDEVYPQFQFDQLKFAQALLPNTKENLQVRYQLKYAAHRGISGTPIFTANSVLIDGAESFTAAQWTDFINQYNPPATTEL